MNADRLGYPRQQPLSAAAPAPDAGSCDRSAGAADAHARELELIADCILDDCLFAMGQVVGTRTTIDYDAVIWLRDHFRANFLRVLHRFGNRWVHDRDNVTAVAAMLGERAVRYASDRSSIDVEAVRHAAADAQRYCALHARRAARAHSTALADSEQPLMAGYWCTY